MKKSFAIIGVAGYVAPRHIKAIQDCGHELVAAMDVSDSVGIMDQYFPNCFFFTTFERFDRHLFKRKQSGNPIDFLVVCTPNHLHDAHIRFGLHYGCDVICEKPLVLNPWNLDGIEALISESQKKVWSILQLRLHPNIPLIQKYLSNSKNEVDEVSLNYITKRGNWYFASWKGEEDKSGGILMNIGIHLFDILLFLFGEIQSSEIHVRSFDRASGILHFKKTKVKWFLSVNTDYLPDDMKQNEQRTLRELSFGNRSFDFSQGFEDLHSHSYQQILNGNGFQIKDIRPSIQLVYDLRHASLVEDANNMHPLALLPQSKHPFDQ